MSHWNLPTGGGKTLLKIEKAKQQSIYFLLLQVPIGSEIIFSQFCVSYVML